MNDIDSHNEMETTTHSVGLHGGSDTEPDVSAAHSSHGDIEPNQSLGDDEGGVTSEGDTYGESGSENEFEDDLELDEQTYQSDPDGESDVSGLEEPDNDGDLGGLDDGSGIEEIDDESDGLEEVDDICTEESDDESECDDDK